MSWYFAVIGNPIAHSLSPIIHQLFAKQVDIPITYEKIHVEASLFQSQVMTFFAQKGCGLNVTLPFKQKAFAMAQQHTVRCKKAQAANTLWMEENQLCADNTDGIGLIRDLERYISLPDTRILILGGGGAARGIIYPLLENKVKTITLANRTLSKTQELQRVFPEIKCIGLSEIAGQFDVLINATSASLSGEFIVLPGECFASRPFCYDLSYKQNSPTAFVQYTRKLGCDCMDGLGMLVEQAAEAFFIWNKVMPQTREVLEFLRTKSDV